MVETRGQRSAPAGPEGDGPAAAPSTSSTPVTPSAPPPTVPREPSTVTERGEDNSKGKDSDSDSVYDDDPGQEAPPISAASVRPTSAEGRSALAEARQALGLGQSGTGAHDDNATSVSPTATRSTPLISRTVSTAVSANAPPPTREVSRMVRDVAEPAPANRRVVSQNGGRAVILQFGRLSKRLSVYKGMDAKELMILLRTVFPMPTEDYVALEVTLEVIVPGTATIASTRGNTVSPQKSRVVETYPLSFLAADPDFFCGPKVVMVNIFTAAEAERRRRYRPPPPSNPWYYDHFFSLVFGTLLFIFLVSETVRGFVIKRVTDSLYYVWSACYMSTWSLYRFGPGFDLPFGLSIGFWGGAHHSQICQSVTSTDQTFWLRNDDQCQALVRGREEFFITWTWIVIGLVTSVFVLVLLMWWLMAAVGPVPPPPGKHLRPPSQRPSTTGGQPAQQPPSYSRPQQQPIPQQPVQSRPPTFL